MSRYLLVLQTSALKEVYRVFCLAQGQEEPTVIPETFTLGSKRGFSTFLCRKGKLTLLREHYS